MADPATNLVIEEYLRELQAAARTRAVIAQHDAVFPIDILVSLFSLLLSTKETPEKIVTSTLGIISAVPALSGRVDIQAPVPGEFERLKNALGLTLSANEAIEDFREMLQEHSVQVRRGVRWTEMVRLINYLTELPSAHSNLVNELSQNGVNELRAWLGLVTTIATRTLQDETLSQKAVPDPELLQVIVGDAQANAVRRKSEVVEPVDFLSALLDWFVMVAKSHEELPEIQAMLNPTATFQDWLRNPPYRQKPSAVRKPSLPQLDAASQHVLQRITSTLPTSQDWTDLALLISDLVEEKPVFANLDEVLHGAYAGSIRNWASQIRDDALISKAGIPPAETKEIVVIADLDQVPSGVVADFMAALDRYHRALGGSGLTVKDDYIAVYETAEVEST